MKFEHYGTFKQATNIGRSAVDSTELATTVDVVSVVNSRRRSPTIDHVQLSVYSMMVVSVARIYRHQQLIHYFSPLTFRMGGTA